MIQQILVGSTTNVTPQTMHKIEEATVGITTFTGPYGCFIYVLDDVILEQKVLKQTDLLLLTAAARDQGCSWIFLDNQEEPINHLPDYADQWEHKVSLGSLMY